jgi:Na+-translocating ferredoxin:NAD+ oxidoreductase RnfG subunit
MTLCVAALTGYARFASASPSDLHERITLAFARVFSASVQHEYAALAIDDSVLAEVRRRCGAKYGHEIGIHIARDHGKIVGYGVVDDARGKEQPITYLLCVNPDCSVKDLEVLYYREAYGGEVQSETWLRQFIGKSPADQLHVGNDIMNISGATISTNAVTWGAKKVLTILGVLRERKMLP